MLEVYTLQTKTQALENFSIIKTKINILGHIGFLSKPLGLQIYEAGY